MFRYPQSNSKDRRSDARGKKPTQTYIVMKSAIIISTLFLFVSIVFRRDYIYPFLLFYIGAFLRKIIANEELFASFGLDKFMPYNRNNFKFRSRISFEKLYVSLLTYYIIDSFFLNTCSKSVQRFLH